jgi:hypothetical protein
MGTIPVSTLRMTPLLFWLVFQPPHASQGLKPGEPEQAESDTAVTASPTAEPHDPIPEEIMNEVELLTDFDIIMDLEFLELLEMLEADSAGFAEAVREETHHDSAGQN